MENRGGDGTGVRRDARLGPSRRARTVGSTTDGQLAEDPQESGRNITAAAYRFQEVKALFHAAGEAMSAEGELTFLTEVAAAATRPPTWNDAEEESDEDPYPIGILAGRN